MQEGIQFYENEQEDYDSSCPDCGDSRCLGQCRDDNPWFGDDPTEED